MNTNKLHEECVKYDTVGQSSPPLISKNRLLTYSTVLLSVFTVFFAVVLILFDVSCLIWLRPSAESLLTVSLEMISINLLITIMVYWCAPLGC